MTMKTCAGCGRRGWDTSHHRALLILIESVTSVPMFIVEQYGVYRGCVLGKNVKDFFSSSESISEGILDLSHLDVCGLMSMESMQGALYYVIIIDKYSKKTWIFFMKTKDGVFSGF